jgi:hypothetical protein
MRKLAADCRRDLCQLLGRAAEPVEPTDMPVVTVTVDPLGSAKVVVIGAADVLSA